VSVIILPSVPTTVSLSFIFSRRLSSPDDRLRLRRVGVLVEKYLLDEGYLFLHHALDPVRCAS
jgi:hypothetical protein